MNKEVFNRGKRQTCYAIQRVLVPDKANIIPGTLVFKCKRRTDSTFCSFKARFCVRVYIQNQLSDKYMNAYATVVQWSTVSLTMVMTCIIYLKMHSADLINSFTQAELVNPININPLYNYL